MRWWLIVSNAENALREVKRKMYNHYKLLFKKEWWVDHGRKAIIVEQRGIKFFVLFKRETFHSYGKIMGEIGEGESINVLDFEYAVYDQDIEEFLYIYPNNDIYKIRARDLRRSCKEWVNNQDGKKQYIFNIKELQRIA